MLWFWQGLARSVRAMTDLLHDIIDLLQDIKQLLQEQNRMMNK